MDLNYSEKQLLVYTEILNHIQKELHKRCLSLPTENSTNEERLATICLSRLNPQNWTNSISNRYLIHRIRYITVKEKIKYFHTNI